jgi:hypothetical protein
MNTRLIPLALTVALLLSLGVVAGCGDDNGDGNGGALTLAEYFEKLDELDETFAAESDAIEAEMDEALTDLEDEDEIIDLFSQSFRDQLDNMEDFMGELGDLEPPAEVEEVHDEAVAAFQESTELLNGFIDDLGDAESISDFEALDDAALEAASERRTQACLDVEQSAADNGIDLDLSCGDEDEEG